MDIDYTKSKICCGICGKERYEWNECSYCESRKIMLLEIFLKLQEEDFINLLTDISLAVNKIIENNKGPKQ